MASQHITEYTAGAIVAQKGENALSSDGEVAAGYAFVLIAVGQSAPMDMYANGIMDLLPS